MPNYIVRSDGPFDVYGVSTVTIPEAQPSALCYSFGFSNDYNDNCPVEGIINSFSIDGANHTSIHIDRVAPYYMPADFYVGATVFVSGVLTPYGYLNGVEFTVQSVSNDSPAINGFTVVCSGLTHAAVGATSIAGLITEVAIPSGSEIGELLTGTGSVPQAGLQFALPAYTGQQNNAPAITWEMEYPSSPSSMTAYLQGAVRDVDSEYETMDTSTVSGLRTVPLGQWRVKFVRIMAWGVGGTDPSVIGKIII
jgi:hypothetical protein